ncbi:MAG: TadE/TadG family type IV pilus assembly protein, partial [Planctomycetota bacterium]
PLGPMKNSRKNRRQIRKGAATIELAVCIPVLVLLVLGSLEACNVIFLKQMVTAAAYEAARVAVTQEAGPTEAEQRATDVLQSRGVQGFGYTSVPADPSQVDTGEDISITVSAPASANSLINFEAFGSTIVSATIVMQKQ